MKQSYNSNKTALITGAASGLGFEFAQLLANDGYDLFLVDISDNDLKQATINLKNRWDVDINSISKDLSKRDVSKEIFDFTRGKAIDVLINNAGFGLFGPFTQTSWDRESDMLNLHILTTTQMTKLFLKDMVDRGSGKILNVSSLAAFEPGPLMSIYYASKAYILSFSEAIANELKGTGVTVTTLCPGPTATKFQKVVSRGNHPNNISFNMASARKVAAYGYRAMLEGKPVAIPGFINKCIVGLLRILPRETVSAIVRRIQEKNRPINKELLGHS